MLSIVTCSDIVQYIKPFRGEKGLGWLLVVLFVVPSDLNADSNAPRPSESRMMSCKMCPSLPLHPPTTNTTTTINTTPYPQPPVEPAGRMLCCHGDACLALRRGSI